MSLLGKSNEATELPPVIATGNPTHVWIEPTNRCNTRCVHCGHFYERFGEDMQADLYEKISASVLDSLKSVELIGYGEPFMAKHFDRMFDECNERGIQIFSTSNGILLRNDERVSKLVRSNFVLCLSIDGATKETFESVRPYIKWEKMIETLECIRRNATAAGDEKRFNWRFNFVAMKRNIGELPALVELANEYGVDEIFVLPLGGEEVFEKIQGESLHDSPELVSPNYLRALALAAKYDIHLTLPSSFYGLVLNGRQRGNGIVGKMMTALRKARLMQIYSRRRSISHYYKRLTRVSEFPRAKAGVTYCSMPWKDAYFASDGTVFPCCIMGENLGNMNKQDWSDIWNGPLYRNLRRTVHSWNPTAVCRTCALPTGINGGDEKMYQKFFSRFTAESLALDDPAVKFDGGFHEIERSADGMPSHIWMNEHGKITLPLPKGAKFIRLLLIQRSPVHETNPGMCEINDGAPEPFDNSCSEVHFPVKDARSCSSVQITLHMENSYRVENDDRRLALAIRGIEFLK